MDYCICIPINKEAYIEKFSAENIPSGVESYIFKNIVKISQCSLNEFVENKPHVSYIYQNDDKEVVGMDKKTVENVFKMICKEE
jgi:hypothetical protein